MLFWGTAVFGLVLLVWYMREDKRIDGRLLRTVGFGSWTARVASALAGVLLLVGTLFGVFAYLMFSMADETMRWRDMVSFVYLNNVVLAMGLLAYACVYSKAKRR